MTETVRMLEHKGGHLRNLNNQEKIRVIRVICVWKVNCDTPLEGAAYMQLTTPMLVPMAVRIVMSVWITSFQMSRFSIVPITIYQLQCTIHLFSSPPSQGGSGRVSPLFLTGHNAKIQFCALGCQEGWSFWRRFNTSRACHSECSEESERASKSIILLMFTDSSVPSEWQEMEAPVCLQFLCRLTIAKSGFVRIIHILCNKGEGKDGRGAHANAITVITNHR